jgi:7,8-dihydropterin-6-yl-methyl-4-(beta-D-ribofuranosyl)aminobenzene 5'-phosphate synthase
MKVTVLAENSVCKTNTMNVKPEHGLSLFIEFDARKILFDTGQSDLFIQNAGKLGIDLSQVDYLFISHGHFDHGGGLKHFLEINKKAKIFLHRFAFNIFYTRIFGLIPYYVGLDKKIFSRNINRINFITSDTQIDYNIVLLEGFPEVFPQPESNKTLFEKVNMKLIHDKFRHELALILIEKDEIVIFSGCSHSGIINIVQKVKSEFDDKKIKATFGGFHIHNPISKKNESPEYIEKIAVALGETESVFYTGHCTGEINFRYLKGWMSRKIQTMNTGDVIAV